MLTRLPVLRARSVVAAMAHQNGISHASSNTPRTPAVFSRSASQLAISPQDDDPAIRTKYRPFLHDIRHVTENDWVSKLELTTVESLVAANLEATQGNRLKVLVLYGSLRSRSYSKLLSYEFSRILHRLGCDVRVFDPSGLPMKDDVQTDHPKVQELRNLSQWSDGHVWVSPEQHGNLVSHEMPCMVVTSADNHSQTGVFKTQIDWIPLSTGSVRPTQGRTLAIAQVSGGSQSFNSVNSLRILGRWMRMFTIPNQSSIPMAYKQFTDAVDPADEQAYIAAEGGSRLMPSSNRDRVVDCMEEFVKYTIIMRPHFESFGDRYSERTERKTKEEQAAKKAQEIVEAKSNDQKDGVVNGVNLNGI